jgi:hypothetical protein
MAYEERFGVEVRASTSETTWITTVMSKKTLSVIRGVPIEGEASGQRPPQSSQALYCIFSPAITPDRSDAL